MGWVRGVIEVVALAFLVFSAVEARSGLPTLPLSTWDSWGFLNPALSWLSGDGFQQTNGRDWFYPGLLTLFLKVTGSYAGIYYWQTALGILSVVLMAVAWRLWTALLPVSPWVRLGATLAGMVPIWIQITNPQTILFEMMLRPEGIMPFFVYGQMACLLAYGWYRWQRPQGGWAVTFGALALLLAYACLLLKPSWLFAFLITVAPVFIGVLGRGVSWRSRLLTPVLGMGLCLVLLWLPPKLWYVKDSASVTFLPSTLFTVHADLMEEQLAGTIARLPDGDPEKASLTKILDHLRRELEVARTIPHTYRKLGFDPDYLYYRSDLLGTVYDETGKTNEAFRAFCIREYLKMAFLNPVRFTEKVWRQFTYFLFPDPGTLYRFRINFEKDAQAAVESLEPHFCDRYQPEIREAYLNYLKDLEEIAAKPPTLERKTVARKWSQVFAAWALPLEILFLVSFVMVLARSALADLRWAGWGALLFLAIPAANAFTVALVHALDIARYRQSYGGFLLFALTAMAVFVLLVIGKSLRPLVGRLLSSRQS